MLQSLSMQKEESSDERASIEQRLPFMNSLFRYKDPYQNGLKYWRERIVFSALAVGMGLSMVALVPAVRMAVNEKLWALLIFDLIVFTLAILLVVLKRISLEFRSAVVLLITFVIGVMVICQVGFLSGGTAWLFCFAVLTGVLMGLRAALIAVTLNAVVMITLAWMTQTGQIIDLGSLISPGRAITAIANFLFLNAVCAVSVAVLVTGLEALNKRIQAATIALSKEQDKLVSARESLKQEVVERKESEQAALESERKYRLLAENIRDVIWTMNIDLNFTYVSPAVSQMLEWTAAEFLNLTLNQIMTPDSFRGVVDTYDRQYEYGKRTGDFNWSGMLELELYTKSGASVWTEVTAGFILGADGRPVGILGAARDINERLRAQKEKEELLESLNRSRKMEALGTLAGGVAHDLNNVLSGIVSYPDLLLMDIPDNSPLRQPIETMRNSGIKAGAIVQDLLTLARRSVSVSEVLNLNEVIKEYLDSPEFNRLKSYHPLVEVNTRLAPNLSHTLGSPLHLFKSLMNLVSNAAEAMPDGGKLTISTENCHFDRPFLGYTKIPEGDFTLLKVSDTGIGISAEDINRIFEPFYTKKKMGRSGTGLGMAVVWGTVEDHNAFIDIESANGRGTIIAIYLPVTDQVIATAPVPKTLEEHRGAGESILVVDDVKEQREVATRILEQLGYRALSASGGEEAIDHLEKNPVDLMLLDMIMDPGIDGLDTYKRILKHHPNQRAIITSGYAETRRVKEARRLGAGGYLKKPYTVDTLGEAIRAELSR